MSIEIMNAIIIEIMFKIILGIIIQFIIEIIIEIILEIIVEIIHYWNHYWNDYWNYHWNGYLNYYRNCYSNHSWNRDWSNYCHLIDRLGMAIQLPERKIEMAQQHNTLNAYDYYYSIWVSWASSIIKHRASSIKLEWWSLMAHGSSSWLKAPPHTNQNKNALRGCMQLG